MATYKTIDFDNGDEGQIESANGEIHWKYADGAGWVITEGEAVTIEQAEGILNEINSGFDDYKED